MKSLISIFFLLLSLNLSFAQIPESSRSKKAIEKQLPILKQEFSNQGLELGEDIFIRIFKTEKRLEIWVKEGGAYKLFREYKICTYSGAIGTKKREGDMQAPEGFYSLNAKSLNPYSQFHLSVNIGYPNQYDRQNGYTGSSIMIHGNCVSIGCFAMTDERIEEIYTIIVQALNGAQQTIPVHIFPFKLSEKKLERFKRSGNYLFWKNLKEGYDLFEAKKIPPRIKVVDKKYVFSSL